MKDDFFLTDLRRCVASRRFAAVVLLIALISAAGNNDILHAIQSGGGSVYSSLFELENNLTFDKFKCVLAAVLAALYAGSFVEDREHHYLRYILSRISLEKYVACRLLTVWFSTVLATVCGFGLMCLTLKLTGVMNFRFTPDANQEYFRFYSLARSDFAFLYLILLGVNFGMSAAVAAVFGMWLSTYRNERYVAVGGAILSFYFLYAISNYFLPGILSFEAIGSSLNQREFRTNAGVVLYHLVYLGLWYAAAGSIFYHAVNRRWERGQLV